MLEKIKQSQDIDRHCQPVGEVESQEGGKIWVVDFTQETQMGADVKIRRCIWRRFLSPPTSDL
jgi:hypothetical protein